MNQVIYHIYEPTFCHLVNPRFGDFYAGMLHVITSLEHVLSLVGLGLLAGQLGPAIARKTLLTFTLALFSGAWIGYLLGDIQVIEYINIFSFILLGLLVALRIRLQAPWVVLISVLFGLTLGFSNGTAITGNMVPLTFIAGVGLMGFLVVTIFSGLVLSLRKTWEQIAVRVLGSWIAAIGMIYIPFLFLE